MVCVSLLVLLGIIFAPAFVYAFASGLQGMKNTCATVSMTRMLSLYSSHQLGGVSHGDSQCAPYFRVLGMALFSQFEYDRCLFVFGTLS